MFTGVEPAFQPELVRGCELCENIIEPLPKREGVEAFQANLVDANTRICDGALHGVREVEVVLVSNFRVSDLPPSIPSSLVLTTLRGLPNLAKSSRGFENA